MTLLHLFRDHGSKKKKRKSLLAYCKTPGEKRTHYRRSEEVSCALRGAEFNNIFPKKTKRSGWKRKWLTAACCQSYLTWTTDKPLTSHTARSHSNLCKVGTADQPGMKTLMTDTVNTFGDTLGYSNSHSEVKGHLSRCYKYSKILRTRKEIFKKSLQWRIFDIFFPHMAHFLLSRVPSCLWSVKIFF